MELNKVLLVGNLGRDPETKYLPSGDAVADFSIAMNRRFKDRQGEMKDETTWVKVTCYGKTAEFAANYLHKGKSVFIEGRLRESKWETPEGQKRSQLDVIAERVQFAAPKGAEGGGGEHYASAGSEPSQERAAAPSAGEGATNDDLPF